MPPILHALIVEDTPSRIDAFIRNNPTFKITHTPNPLVAQNLLLAQSFSIVCLDYNLSYPTALGLNQWDDTSNLSSWIEDHTLYQPQNILIHTNDPTGALCLMENLHNFSLRHRLFRIEQGWDVPNLLHILTSL